MFGLVISMQLMQDQVAENLITCMFAVDKETGT